jgi:tRNA(adenine34) deaminase
MLAGLSQARLALEAGNMPIGAAIVHEGRVIALGQHAIDRPPTTRTTPSFPPS